MDQIKEKILTNFFNKFKKPNVLADFPIFRAIFFFKKFSAVTYIPVCPLTPCKVSEKN